jgi:hypothetical protein
MREERCEGFLRREEKRRDHAGSSHVEAGSGEEGLGESGEVAVEVVVTDATAVSRTG